MELISKEELKKLETIMWDEALGFKPCVLMDDIEKLQSMKLVQCKGCEHWTDGVNGCTDHVKCCKIGYYMVGENGYCVYGEEKTK